MMTTRRHSADTHRVSDLMTTLTPIFRSTILSSRASTASCLSGLVRAAAVCLGLAAVFLSPAKAQQLPVAQPVIVADFNHDGMPDVLVPSATSATATIAFGAVPYGTFSASAKAVNFPGTCTSIPQDGIVVGDFNGDGFPDLAFACDTLIGVIPGKGDGTFGNLTVIASPTANSGLLGTSRALIPGDFNHDGKLDLVVLATVVNGQGTFQVLYLIPGFGDGTFDESNNIQLAANSYTLPVAADLNGDGYTDLLMINAPLGGSPSLEVFGNDTNRRFGTVAQGVYSANAVISLSNSGASSILVGNFFGRATTDVVVVGAGGNPDLFAFKNTSTATTYAFNDPVTIPVARLTGAMAGYFTGSGFADLAVSNGTSISVYTNDGVGNFAASFPTLTVASTSPLFAVADANGDGYTDIYTATSTNGALQLAANVTTGSATATSQPFSLGIGTKAVSAAWKGNVNLLASNAVGQQIVTGAISATSVTSGKNPSTVGDSVTFSASVVPAITGRIPTGNVVFSDGATVLATVLLDSTGNASYMTGTLTQGTHLISVAYAGDSYFAASVSTVLSQVVNRAAAVASNLSWATPAAIVYGTTLSPAQLNATATDATGVAIPGTFTYTPTAGTVLDAGARTVSVTFTPTDLLSFLPATKTVTLTVTQAAPVLTWATPASIVYGVPLSATQLNAAVVGVTNVALPGTYTYSPASGTVLGPGTQTLSVSFVPTNALDYTNASGSVKIVVSGVTVASFTPNTANLGDPATKITLTGAGFVATSVVQVNGAAIPTTLVNATTLTAIVPASDFLKPGTLQITVADPSVNAVSTALSLTVTAPNPGATITAPPTTPPGSQPTITVALTRSYPIDLIVTLNLSFSSSTTPQITNNQQLQLACQDVASNCVLNSANNTLSFMVPANTTTIPVILLQAGTIAGTITVPITLNAGGVDVTPSTLVPAVIVVPPAVPSVSDMTVTRSGNQLTVIMHGFSNTREVVNAKFHFTAAPGATLGTADLTLPADLIFNTNWFDTTPSDAYGSTFTYTQIFNISDSAANIGSVDATLTNSVGASPSTTAK